jgi:hypothetical protein
VGFFLRCFFPVLSEAFYLIIGILIFCLSFSLKHCIRQRERKSKYHIICFSFCTFFFQNRNYDNNLMTEMATGSTYKDEVQPFATGSKIESSIVFFFI